MQDSSGDEVSEGEHGVEEYSDHSHEDQSIEEDFENDIPSGNDEKDKEPLSDSQNVSLNKSATGHLPSDDLTSMLQKTRDEDRKKGRAISKQIVRFPEF